MGKKSILLIDDEKIIREEFFDIFHDSEYTLDSASNSIEGKKKLLSSKYDLVILDIRMPDLNNCFSESAGIDLLKLLKKNKPQLPVIMLSVINEAKIAVDAMKLGASDYIIKDSFTVEELIDKVESTTELNEELILQNKIENILIYNKDKNEKFDKYETYKTIQSISPIKLSKYEKVLDKMKNEGIIKIDGSKISLLN